MVEPQPSKLMVWVRFPSPAPDKVLKVESKYLLNIDLSALLLLCPYSSVGRALPW